MPTPIVPTTELDAVNYIIGTIGETPVTTLTNPGLADASLAYALLGTVSREVQSRGWQFNREYEYPLASNSDTTITMPPNCLQISVARSMKQTWDLAFRGGVAYDRKNQTKFITAGNGTLPVKFDMTVLLVYTDLPESARWYIATRAGRQFLDRTMGEATLHGFTQKDEDFALDTLKDAEGENEDFNILTDNYTVFRTLDRNAGNQLINT